MSGPREAFTIVGELHALLEAAGIPAPYVMAGHSYGAIQARVYAAQVSAAILHVIKTAQTSEPLAR